MGICCWAGPTNTAGWVGGTIPGSRVGGTTPGSRLGVVGCATPVTPCDQAREVGISAKVTNPGWGGGGE